MNQLMNPNLLEVLTHELINSVGLVSMNFELLSDAASDTAMDENREMFEQVDRSLADTVEVLQLLNACSIALQGEVGQVEQHREFIIPLLKWHVRRYGLPATHVKFQWSTPTRLDFVTDEPGIFERGDSGLPMSIFQLMSLKDRMRLNKDGSTATVDLWKLPKMEKLELTRQENPDDGVGVR